MEWAAIAAAIVKFLSTIGPVLALWLAHRAGQKAGKSEANYEQTTVNAKARQEYERIEVEGVTDADTDRILKNRDL